MPQRVGHPLERVARADVRAELPVRQQGREFPLAAAVFRRIEISELESQQVRDTLAELGSAAPDSDAALIAHATIGTLAERLRQRSEPAPGDVERVTAFCLRALTPPEQGWDAQASSRSSRSGA
ncbi:hypothetical protein [Nocardia asiatica]|uniref:hypothetical protein n=1 Tax=Nocardia asiatica TaxID=209252 RepID=UPI003EE234E8